MSGWLFVRASSAHVRDWKIKSKLNRFFYSLVKYTIIECMHVKTKAQVLLMANVNALLNALYRFNYVMVMTIFI